MSIKIGSISAKDIYVGSTPAKEIRLGSTLIWSRAPVYYTLTLNGIESEGINGYSVYINEILQPTASTYQILKGSFVQVSIDVDTFDYYYDFTSNIGGEADAGDGWYMDKDAIITVSTTLIEKTQYTLTINLGEGIDYTDIWYKEPNSLEWVEASKMTSITAPEGTEYYIEVGYLDGYYPNYEINLGSESQPLVLDNDTTIDIYGFAEESEEYNITVRTIMHGYSSVPVGSITIKANGSVIGSSVNSDEASAVHNGTDPITVEVSYIGSYNGFEWTGSIQPTKDYISNIFSWDSLPEDGTLTVNFSN